MFEKKKRNKFKLTFKNQFWTTDPKPHILEHWLHCPHSVERQLRCSCRIKSPKQSKHGKCGLISIKKKVTQKKRIQVQHQLMSFITWNWYIHTDGSSNLDTRQTRPILNNETINKSEEENKTGRLTNRWVRLLMFTIRWRCGSYILSCVGFSVTNYN